MEVLTWFLLEALTAAALLVLVVWWTFPRKRKSAQEPTNEDQDKSPDSTRK